MDRFTPAASTIGVILAPHGVRWDTGGMVSTADLEAERGHTSGLAPAPWSWFGHAPSAFVVDPVEDNPDLRFPASVPVFDTMARTDPQVSATLRAIRQPILSAPWDLTGDDVDPAVTAFVRTELGLTQEGAPRRRARRHGVLLTHHLRDALSVLVHGFAVFEQVYAYDPQDGRLHLRKLAPRPQRTIRGDGIHVGPDGGLVGVTQEPAPSRNLATHTKPVFIPVRHLVWYSLEQEGADWTGTSMLRSAYRPWLLKDRAERITAQAIERNAMGVPVGYTDETGEAGAEFERQLSQFRAGATSYLKVPGNSRVELLTPGGGLIDPLPFIKRQDEAISKSMLAMFLDLGHDAGARSLGESFVEMFLTSCQAVADTLADVLTEHVVRDLVEHNFGEGTAYPVVTPGDLLAARGLDVEGLSKLAQSGLIVSDEPIRAAIRTRHGYPAEDPATAVQPPQTPAEPAVGVALSDPSHLDRLDTYLTRLEQLRAPRPDGEDPA